jgi:cytochrome c peroxidase
LSFAAIPEGLATPIVPVDSPLTLERVELGRKLFFDPILSEDRTIACASCHIPEKGFSGGTAKSKGIHGLQGRRRSPSLLNRSLGTAFFWDGRAKTLEDQALKPLADPTEMGTSVELITTRLKADSTYNSLFTRAFPEEGVSAQNLARALASFQRVLLRGNSPIDRFRKGERDQASVEAAHGFWLYESKGGCWRCHSGSNFTDEKFHNTGVSWGREPLDLGRFEHTGEQEDRGRFKTPSLRGVELTAPYMHDGSLATLEDVIEFYDRGGVRNPNLDSAIKPLNLSSSEKKALVAFLKSL